MSDHALSAREGADSECIAAARIAVVDNEPSVLEAVSSTLESAGFQIERFCDGASALDAFSRNPPDLAVIDLVMPRMDGMELMRRTREHWSFPIIMLTARDDEVDEVLSLRLGADDYMRKPFSQRLLVERVRVGLRRSAVPAAQSDCAERPLQCVMRRGPLEMDAGRHLARWQGKEVSLTVTEFNLLQALALNPGYVKSRDQLMDVAYDAQVYVDDRTIDSHIKRLRKKMRAIDPEFRAIETLYGVGYKYMPATA